MPDNNHITSLNLLLTLQSHHFFSSSRADETTSVISDTKYERKEIRSRKGFYNTYVWLENDFSRVSLHMIQSGQGVLNHKAFRPLSRASNIQTFEQHTGCWEDKGREEGERKTKMTLKPRSSFFPFSCAATLCCASEWQHSLSYRTSNGKATGKTALASSPVLTISSLLLILQDKRNSLWVSMGQFNNQAKFNF